MGLVDIARNKSASGMTIDEFFNQFFRGSTTANAGVSVNETTAMRFSVVWGCIMVISQTLAWPPLKIWQARPTGGRDEAKLHPLNDILHYAPNDDMPAITLKETVHSHTLLSGNGYALPTRNKGGEIVDLYPAPWTHMEPRRNPITRALEYRYIDRGKEEVLPPEKVFHIPGLGFDGIKGYSPIRMCMEAIGLGLAAEQFAALFYANGANIGGFLAVEGGTGNKERRDEIRKELENKFKGLSHSHEVMILPKGTEFHRLEMPLAEAQFIETRKFQVEEIARIYRVPLHLLQNLDRATFSNIEHQDLGFVKHTMMPWYVRWEQYINQRLLTRAERQKGLYAEFNLNALLRGDSKTQAEIAHFERQDGFISTNEYRERRGQNPRPEPEADELFINGNMVRLVDAGKVQPQRPPSEPPKGGA